MDPQDFLRTVHSLVQADPRSATADGLPLSSLGVMLRSRGGLDWTTFGYPKLSNVLVDLQKQQSLRLDFNGKHAMAVWSNPEGTSVPSVPPGPTVSDQVSPTTRRLLPQVWQAFIRTPHGRPPLVNRTTGEVWLLPEAPSNEGGNWIPADPIDQEEQREWARDVLRTEGLAEDANLGQALAMDNWYVAFPQVLTSTAPNAVVAWNRLRSQRVQRHVELWCARNGVPHQVVLEAPRYSTEKGGRAEPHADVLRESLLAALARMTTEELLGVPVPAKYMVEVLRPELLRRSGSHSE